MSRSKVAAAVRGVPINTIGQEVDIRLAKGKELSAKDGNGNRKKAVRNGRKVAASRKVSSLPAASRFRSRPEDFR
jgi:hypothetical protein